MITLNVQEHNIFYSYIISGILKSGPLLQSLALTPNQTHLSMLIRVFKIIRKLQVGEFDKGWS